MANQYSRSSVSIELDSRNSEIEAFLKDSYSAAEISVIMGYSYSAIYRTIIRNNLQHYIHVSKNGKLTRTKKRKLEDKIKISKENLEELYLIQKKDLYEIAKIYHVDAATVFNYMRKYHISTRTKSEAMRLIYEKSPEKRERQRQLAYDGTIGIHRKGFNRKDSWIEKEFESFCLRNNIEYKKQYQIDGKGHRYDFLIENNLLVEVDGEYWHNTDKQKNLDSRHEMFAIQRGYGIVRFTDTVIEKTKGACFDELIKSN